MKKLFIIILCLSLLTTVSCGWLTKTEASLEASEDSSSGASSESSSAVNSEASSKSDSDSSSADGAPSMPDVSEALSQADIASDLQTSSQTEDVSKIQTSSEVSAELSAELYILQNADVLGTEDSQKISAELLRFAKERYGIAPLEAIAAAIADGSYTSVLWHQATGDTLNVISDRFSGAITDERLTENDIALLAFAGDVNFADNWELMDCLKSRNMGLDGVLQPKLAERLRGYDFFTVNNEFCASLSGEPLSGKAYCFRADPNNLAFYNDMGVDLVSVANNHVFDFGAAAFSDTLKALDSHGIAHIGAGETLSSAIKPYYLVISGRKLAFLAGSRAEKHFKTPLATKDSAGVFGIYDTADMCRAIEEASRCSDIVIVCPHWGAEDSTKTEDVIRADARKYIDCGADVIVGTHAHRLQEIEFYNGKLIAYNLGNFLFGTLTARTGIIELQLATNGTITPYFQPCMHGNAYTALAEGDEREDVLDFIRRISPNVIIDDDGKIHSR